MSKKKEHRNLTRKNARKAVKALQRSKEPTRAQAQVIIAGTTDVDVIRSLGESHPNSHIKRYAAHKVAQLQAQEVAA